MKYPNALSGIKKVYTGQILMIISNIAVVFGAALMIVSLFGNGASGLSIDDAYASAGAGAIITLAGTVITVIAFIFNIVGLRTAGKDESNFNTAFWMAIIGLVLSIASAATQAANPSISSWLSFGSTLFEIAVIEIAVIGIISLATKLRSEPVASFAEKLRILITILWVIVVVLEIFKNRIDASFLGIMALVGGLLQLVVYILYIVLLGKSKKMLK